jgi:PAS domain S-box-containing protein
MMDSFEKDYLLATLPLKKIGLLTGMLAVVLGLYAASLHNYLLFHSLIEIITVATGFTLFILAWNTRHYQTHAYLKILGIGYAFIALIDLTHSLAYKGMNVFRGYDTNLPTQLWIAARYLQALTLAVAPFLAGRRGDDRLILGGYAATVSLIFLMVFSGNFPDCYLPGQGLTTFKIFSEYLISLVLLFSLWPLYRIRGEFKKPVYNLVVASVICTVLSEISFTTYISVYSPANMAGHFLKLAAFYLLYRAVLVTAMKDPLNMIFRELEQSRAEQQKMAGEIGLLLESTGEGIIGVDARGRCTFINRAGAEILGYCAEELKGQDIHQLIHHHHADGRDYPENECPMNYTIWKGGIFHWDDDVLWRRDGSPFRVEYSSYPILENGESKGAVVIFKDITERKRIEEREQKLHEDLTATLKAIPDLMLEVERSGRIVDYRIPKSLDLGLDRKAVLDRTLAEAFPAEAEGPIRQAIDDAARQGWHQGNVFSLPSPQGMKWYELSAAAKGGNQAPEARFVLLARDITDRKLSEEALRQAKEEWEMTFDSVPDLIAILDKNHQIVRANKAMLNRLGCSGAGCAGLKCFSVVHGTNAPLKSCPFSLTLADGREHIAEIHEEHLGGDFLVSTTPVRNGRGELTGTVHVARDITERKRIQEERLIISKLESAGILAGGIAHDFNNLLSVILGNLDLATLSADDKDLMTPLQGARQAVLEARVVTQQLITVARGGEPMKKTISLSGLLEEQATFSLRGSEVQCQFSIPADLAAVEVDGEQFGQVVRNIVLNAREAMNDTGRLRVEAANIQLTEPSGLALPAGSYVKVSFTDQGHGIPEKILSKIFDPYFSSKQRGRQKGMGLGLTISRSIVQKHGGTVTAESPPGKGTTMQIYLPASPLCGAARAEAGEEVSGTARVLVMDDDEMVRTLTGAILDRLGYEFELAENGETAIEHYQAAREHGCPFDVAILDLTVAEGMGGKETINRLLKIDPDIKVIASSGFNQDPIIQNYAEYGFKAALPKPYQISDMKAILSDVIKDHPGI